MKRTYLRRLSEKFKSHGLNINIKEYLDLTNLYYESSSYDLATASRDNVFRPMDPVCSCMRTIHPLAYSTIYSLIHHNETFTLPESRFPKTYSNSDSDRMKEFLLSIIGNDITIGTIDSNILKSLFLYGQFWYNLPIIQNTNSSGNNIIDSINNFQSDIRELQECEQAFTSNYEELIIDKSDGTKQYRSSTYIATGYALFKDGIWRRHTWNIDNKLQLSGDYLSRRKTISTNMKNHIVLYFGTVLPIQEIEALLKECEGCEYK